MSKERLEALDLINECKRDLKGLGNIVAALAESPTETEIEELDFIARAMLADAQKLKKAVDLLQ